MDESSFKFGLDIIDHAIVEALRQALENVMPDIMADNNLQERNAYGQFRWNVIIAQLREQCQHLGWFDIGVCKRRAWKTPVLFHPASRNIFTLMTEGTFSEVQRKEAKGTHYLCGAASFNRDVQPKTEQLQMDLPPVQNTAEQWVANSREQLASAVHLNVGDINGHILVLFDTADDKLLSVRAVRLTSNLAISTEEENWTKYIRMPFTATQTIEPQQNYDDEGEELVELLNYEKD